MECTILLIFIINNQIVNTSLIVNTVTKEMVGNYICQATRFDEQKNASTYLQVMFGPRLLDDIYEGKTYVSCSTIF